MSAHVAQQVPTLPPPQGPTPSEPTPDEPLANDQAEDAQINEIVERLRRRYTREQISTPDLACRVSGFYHQFDDARIRNFVAILVESLVRRSIPSPALSRRVP